MEIGIGRVTAVNETSVVIDKQLEASKAAFFRHDTVRQDDAIEYEAIRCDGNDTRYRCVSARLISYQDKMLLFPEAYADIAVLQRARESKKGLVVNREDVVFEMSAMSDEPQKKVLEIKNISRSINHELRMIEITKPSTSSESFFEVVSPDTSNTTTLRAGSTLEVVIQANSSRVGVFTEHITLHFKGFNILRNLRLVAGRKEFVDKYTSEYEPKQEVEGRQMFKNLQKLKLSRKRPMSIMTAKIRRTFQRSWTVPGTVEEVLKEENWEDYFTENFPHLLEELTARNYTEKLHYSLYFDEMVLFRAFQQNSQFQLVLSKEGEFYRIPVKNVAEMRPSLLNGDAVQLHNKVEGKTVDGFIVQVRIDDVLVSIMDENFSNDSHLAYDVIFNFSRTSYKIQHEAIEKVEKGLRYSSIFPDIVNDTLAPILDVSLDANCCLLIDQESHGKQPLTLTRDDLNVSQKTIICNVLRGQLRTLPYLIRGPPGTGKTTTLVEIMVQLITYSSTATILVCTQSNSAANLILEKLIATQKLQAHEIIRVVSKTVYENDTISPNLRSYCATLASHSSNAENDNIRANVNLETLLSYRIVLVTCGSVGHFYSLNVPLTHFTHLITDESGQCFESEAIVPISLMEHQNSQIILAGDDKQLGPVVQWPMLEECGFGISLFERLMVNRFYDSESADYNSILSSQLSYNYRSIPSILKVYNRLFYKDSLKAMVCALF